MRKSFVTLIAFTSVLLTGCFFDQEDTKSYNPPFQNLGCDGPYDDIPRIDNENGEGYKLYYGSDVPFTKRDLDQSIGGDPLPSIGNSKILVVPVNIKGASRVWNQQNLDKVNKAFFGTADETSWQSVSSFYETASYGKLKIEGEVAPVFNSNITISSLISHYEDGEVRPDAPIVREWVKDSRYYNLRQEYDTDGNNAVDSIAFIYNVPVNSDNGFWAWSTWEDTDGLEAPSVKNYLWASVEFLDDLINANYGKNGIDCHVFIHEVGHLLGIDDYYSYDEWILDASGSLEMHSLNIGDENIYSKYLMGWADPYYVKTSTEVTLNLRSSALYGDAIILNDNWNETPYDEYVILEYYTPQLNNYLDSIQEYKGDYKMYTEPGVRIYHVDSRTVKVSGRDYPFSLPTKALLKYGEYVIGPSNTPSRAYLSNSMANNYRLLNLIDAAGRKYYNGENLLRKTDGIADNNSLFKTGDTFVADSTFFVNDTKFNAGNEVGYSVRINSLSNEYANVTIRKI